MYVRSTQDHEHLHAFLTKYLFPLFQSYKCLSGGCPLAVVLIFLLSLSKYSVHTYVGT